jgi:acetyl-CoA carboxylase carboxyltransferase component
MRRPSRSWARWPPTTTPTSGWTQHRYPGDGIITGFGKIQGRRVAVFAQDFTVLGGSFSEVQSQQDLPHPGPGDPEPASR